MNPPSYDSPVSDQLDTGNLENTIAGLERFVQKPDSPPQSVASEEECPPRPVVDALFLLDELRRGQLKVEQEGDRCMIDLAADDFDLLRQQLRQRPDLKEFIDDKARLDWLPENNCIALRMPSRRHERWIRTLEECIRSEWDALGQGDARVKDLLKLLKLRGSADIELPATSGIGRNKFSPDISIEIWLPKGSVELYPVFVGEVANTEDLEHVRRKANKMISGSLGLISTVLGVNIELHRDGTPRAVSLYIWRPEVVPAENGDADGYEEIKSVLAQKSQIWRAGENGAPGMYSPFDIPLAFFFPWDPDYWRERFRKEPLAQTLSNKAVQLSAPKVQDIIQDMLSTVEPAPDLYQLTGRKRKAGRSESADESEEEQLRSDDEAKFRRLEEQASVRSQNGDSTFCHRSTSGDVL